MNLFISNSKKEEDADKSYLKFTTMLRSLTKWTGSSVSWKTMVLCRTKKLEEILQLLQDGVNNSPTFYNCGCTPNQMCIVSRDDKIVSMESGKANRLLW